MLKKLPLFIAIFVSCLISACATEAPTLSPTSAVNIASIKTVLNEDNSGYNEYLLTVPSYCSPIDFQSELRAITQPNSPTIIRYTDNEYDGFLVSYDFQNPSQIPAQIPNIKEAIAYAMIRTYYPTTDSNGNPISPPEPPPQSYNPNYLKITIPEQSDDLFGKAWRVNVTIKPFLMTGQATNDFFGPGPSYMCKIPTFTYKIVFPSTMTINNLDVEVDPKVEPFSHILFEKSMRNTIEWTIDTEQGYKTWIEDPEVKSKIDQLYQGTPPPRKEDADELLLGPTFILNVQAASPDRWQKWLTQIIVPALTLIGLLLTTIVTIRTLRTRHKSTG